MISAQPKLSSPELSKIPVRLGWLGLPKLPRLYMASRWTEDSKTGMKLALSCWWVSFAPRWQ